MFDDDQETPKPLERRLLFRRPQRQAQNDGSWKSAPGSPITKPKSAPARTVPAPFLPQVSPATQAPPRNRQHAQSSLGPKDAKTNTVGNIFYGSNGYLAIDGYDAYKTWITDQVEPGPHGKASGDHYANFIDCVRSRRAEDIHSPILEAHISTTLVHLANASYRLGRTLKFDAATEQVIADEEANILLRGTYRAPYVVAEEI